MAFFLPQLEQFSSGLRGARNAIPRSALLRAISKFLGRQRKRGQRRDETSSIPCSSMESSPIQQTTLSSRSHSPSLPNLLLLLIPPGFTSRSRPFLSLVILHARLDGAFIVSSERERFFLLPSPPLPPPRGEMFSRSSSRVVWPLKYKQPSASPAVQS